MSLLSQFLSKRVLERALGFKINGVLQKIKKMKTKKFKLMIKI